MKKVIISAILLIAGALAASPFFIGSKIESTVKEQVTLAQERLQQSVKQNPYVKTASIELESYDKRYLDATVKGRLRMDTVFPMENGELLVLDVPINSEITHGPYLGDSGLGWAKAMSRFDISQMNLSESITSDTFVSEDVVDLAGNVTGTMTMSPIKHETESGVTIELLGFIANRTSSMQNLMTSKVDMAVEDIKIGGPDGAGDLHILPFTAVAEMESDDQQKVEYKFSTSELKMKNDDHFDSTIASFSGKGDYAFIEKLGLALGKQEATLTDMTVNVPNAAMSSIKIPEFKLHTSAEQNADKNLDFGIGYRAVLDPASLAMLELPVEIKTASLNMKMGNIPPELLESYMDAIKAIAAIDTENPSEEDGAVMQEQMMGLLQQAINDSVSTAIALKVNNDDGGLDTAIDVRFKPEKELSKEEAMMLMMQAGEDPTVLLNILAGKGHLKLDKSVTDKARLTPMIQMMGAGFVVLDGEMFKSDLLIKDGQVLINDQPIPLGMMMGGAMGGEPDPAEEMSPEEMEALEQQLEQMMEDAEAQ